jgi:V8-like Glu-specific endopeptidase
MLLNVVMSLVNQERAAQIAELLRRYSMMIPVAASPVAAMVGPAFPPAVLTEKIIGENTLKPIAFLARGLTAARSVALVAVTHADQSWTGSGFLVGPDVVLTNHHVVGSAADGAATELRFDFEEDEYGVMRDYSGFGVTSVLAADAKLDFSLLEVAGCPGDTRPHLLPRKDPIRVGDRVSIIQHPGGRPKQVSLQHNLVEYVGGDVVQYVTSTLPGSSGSPVLDDDWKLVALHHAGGMLAEPTTGATYYRNEGIALSSIMGSLSPQLRERLGWNNGGQS